MCSTPQYFDYSIPPSPLFPPVPCVSRASSESSLNSLYDLDGRRLEHSLQYAQYKYTTDSPRTPDEEMSNAPRQQFTEEELEKAFQDLKEPSTPSSRSSPGQRLIHDVNDPQSPWKRSIRLRYSEANMRESNALTLQEASDLLSRDMSSYVNSDDEGMERGSPVGNISPAVASTALKKRLQEAFQSSEESKDTEMTDAQI